MKIVQEWLKDVDMQTLVDTYFANNPIDYQMIPDQDLTLKEIRDRSRANMTNFIERMRTIEVCRDKEPMVFFACRCREYGEEHIVASLCGMKELCTAEKPESYAWDLSSYAEVLGYYIVETKLTIGNIYDVLASIIDEMTFFGLDPEEKEKEKVKEDLLTSIDEIERGEFESFTLADFREKFGLKLKEIDPKGEELRRAILAAEYAYSTYQREKEIANAVRALEG